VKYAILIYGVQNAGPAAGKAARARHAEGVYIVDAPTLASALNWATSRSDTRTSAIEVRPLAAHAELGSPVKRKKPRQWPVS
jgi:hypothetical protein